MTHKSCLPKEYNPPHETCKRTWIHCCPFSIFRHIDCCSECARGNAAVCRAWCVQTSEWRHHSGTSPRLSHPWEAQRREIKRHSLADMAGRQVGRLAAI